MKLTKTTLKQLIQEELSKELKGHLLPLNEDAQMVADLAKAKGLGSALFNAYSGPGTEDDKAQEVLHQLQAWESEGRWDLIKVTKEAFNEISRKEDEDEVIARTRDEDPDEDDGDADKLIAIFQAVDRELRHAQKDRETRKLAKVGEFSPEKIRARALGMAQQHLQALGLDQNVIESVEGIVKTLGPQNTVEVIGAAAAIAKSIGPDKLAQGLAAVMQGLKGKL